MLTTRRLAEIENLPPATIKKKLSESDFAEYERYKRDTERLKLAGIRHRAHRRLLTTEANAKFRNDCHALVPEYDGKDGGWQLVQWRVFELTHISPNDALDMTWTEYREWITKAAAVAAKFPAPAAIDPVGESGQVESTIRRGRLPKGESEAKHTEMLVVLRQHPSLKDDPARLAKEIKIGIKTVKRWLDDDRRKYTESRSCQPVTDDD